VPFASLPGACSRKRISSRSLPIVCVVVCVHRLSVLGEFSGKYNTFFSSKHVRARICCYDIFFDEITFNLRRFSDGTLAAGAYGQLTDAAAGMKWHDKLLVFFIWLFRMARCSRGI